MVHFLHLRVVFTLIALIFSASAAILPSDPYTFADPKHDPLNPLKYIASNTLTGLAFCKLWIINSLPVNDRQLEF